MQNLIQSGHVKNIDFSRLDLIAMVKVRINQTNIEMVKADVKPFIQNNADLAIWSTEYFLKLVDLMKIN